MSDFGETWRLVRGRFDNEVTGLSQDQLNWRMHPEALTIGEVAIHVAGTELSFLSQLMGTELDEFRSKCVMAATEGVVNENPFPFTASEITPETVARSLQLGREAVEPVIDNLTDAIRSKQIKSVLGPMIDGTGTFARLAYHPGYHQGQAYQIKTAPGFPAQ